MASLFGWDFKPRSILATHAFEQIGIKRSWHSTEDGSSDDTKVYFANVTYDVT